MTYLVTGSAGHLGEAIMRRLREAGHAARGLDLKPSPYTDHVGSVADREFVREALHGVDAVIHAATLHKPHVATHPYGDFVETNISGTLCLLEEAVDVRVKAFVFTSTTSTFGRALTPAEGSPAAWITEQVQPIPKNIYGVTKLAAENVCELFALRHGLATVVLRTSRFFPEDDDDGAVRARYSRDNVQANELLYRRVDIADAVDAHLLACEKAPGLRFGRYIISATTPFSEADRADLGRDAASVVERKFAGAMSLFEAHGWHLPARLDRVYVNSRAREDLGWRPVHDFAHVLECLRAGRDFRSPLTHAVGTKGYHDRKFRDGPYPTA